MAPIKGRKSASNKNLPMLSHEFVIQNHADIVSCVAMVIVIGLMIQVSDLPVKNLILFIRFHLLLLQITSPVSSLFVALQYGQATGQNPNLLQTYGTGIKDLYAVFFYFLICIIFHAIIQEYILDVSYTPVLFKMIIYFLWYRSFNIREDFNLQYYFYKYYMHKCEIENRVERLTTSFCNYFINFIMK